MLPDNTFAGRIGIITGGGTGIGFAMARELARLGATIILTSRKEEHLGPAVEKLRSETGRATAAYFEVADVRDSEGVEAMVARVEKERGKHRLSGQQRRRQLHRPVGSAVGERLEYGHRHRAERHVLLHERGQNG